MSKQFKPMLAGEIETDEALAKLNYPLMVSPKLDGIRVLVIDGVAVTRSLKPVRNKFVQSILGRREFNGFDGEVVAGHELDPAAFRLTTTAVMAEHGERPFTYWVFDDFLHQGGFLQRYANATKRIRDLGLNDDFVVPLEHITVWNTDQVVEWESLYLTKGFEGLMLRTADGPYKYNRSTLNEGWLLKLKRGQKVIGEARITGFLERMRNENEATIDHLGHSKRSSHKENKKGRGDLGAFIARDLVTDEEFKIGTGEGLDDKLRQEIWNNKEKYLNQIVRYEWFKYGSYDKPRFPQYVAFRDKDDMS